MYITWLTRKQNFLKTTIADRLWDDFQWLFTMFQGQMNWATGLQGTETMARMIRF